MFDDPLKLYCLTNSRMPTEKANGYQIMKMCSAFAACGCSTTLFYPGRRQTDISLYMSPFDYYTIQKTFNIRSLGGVDWLAVAHAFHPKLEPCGFKVQSVYNALAATVTTSRKWSDYNAVFYSRDIFSTLALLCFRRFIRGKIIYEAHAFPETRARFIVDQFRKLDGLVCITGQLKRLFVDAGFSPERVLVAHDAVDLEQFDISSDRDNLSRHCWRSY